jgi:hypothetical protein
METASILFFGTLLFLAITFLYWKLTHAFAEKEYGKKMFKQWGTKMFYWSGAFYISGGVTVCVIYLLKVSHILVF